MKVRTGFVSNSSSSSFIVLGKKMDFTEAEMKRILKRVYGFKNDSFDEYEDISELRDAFISTLEDDEKIVVGNEPEYIGIPLAEFEDEIIRDEFEIDLQELHHMAEELATRFGFDINEVKIIGGEERY